jgi:hypothetical protein
MSRHASLRSAFPSGALKDRYRDNRHWHDEQDAYTKIVLKPGLEQGTVKELKEARHELA